MAERDDWIQIRCTQEERIRWKQIEDRIDPLGSQADSLMRMLDVYEANPKLFEPEYR